MSEKWYFGFRVLRPTGDWVICGPHDDHDAVMRDRQNMKAHDAEVTTPFTAASKDEALKRVVAGRTY